LSETPPKTAKAEGWEKLKKPSRKSLFKVHSSLGFEILKTFDTRSTYGHWCIGTVRNIGS
jgi:hypothetical protein